MENINELIIPAARQGEVEVLRELIRRGVDINHRDEKGYTQAGRADNISGILEFIQHGALLGDLWMEGHFQVGDPLTNSGSSNTMLGVAGK